MARLCVADPFVISNGELTARIDPFGAELLSLTDGTGSEYMNDADPAFWSGHAPLLFPIVGRLNGDVLRVDGREYPMKQHGFARRSRFELVTWGGSVATFRLEDSAENRAIYPFAFALEMTFALEGASLRMSATVRNPGDVPLPFSFGYHPAFAWPLPGGGENLAHEIQFSEDEAQPIRRLNEEGLLTSTEASPLTGWRLPLSPSLFEADALIWDVLASRRLTYRGMNGVALDIAFPDTPYLGIWQKPGANFICIEPWAGHADPAGFTGEFRDKPGIITLPPGAQRSFRMDVTVRHG